MKLFSLAAAAFLMACTADAATVYVVGLCGTFSNPAPNSAIGGTWACPSAASLGVTFIASEFLVYSSDYSNGLSQTVTAITDWSFSGATFAFPSDVTTSTGGNNSTPAVSTDGLTLNAAASLPPLVLSGFYDNTGSPFSALTAGPTVVWTNHTSVGTAVETTGYAEVVYSTNSPLVPVAAPEPASVFLVGAGLLCVGLVAFVKCSSSAKSS